MLLGDSFELGSAMDWQHHKKNRVQKCPEGKIQL
jgi:hypothetical protein